MNSSLAAAATVAALVLTLLSGCASLVAENDCYVGGVAGTGSGSAPSFFTGQLHAGGVIYKNPERCSDFLHGVTRTERSIACAGLPEVCKELIAAMERTTPTLTTDEAAEIASRAVDTALSATDETQQ